MLFRLQWLRLTALASLIAADSLPAWETVAVSADGNILDFPHSRTFESESNRAGVLAQRQSNALIRQHGKEQRVHSESAKEVLLNSENASDSVTGSGSDGSSEDASRHDASADSWTLLFRQTMPFEWPKSLWVFNAHDPSAPNYARLVDLDSFRDPVTKKFEFKMKWPNDGLQEQHWKQSSDPTKAAIAGYEPVDTPYRDNFWGGLEKGGEFSLMDGSTQSEWWFFSIGAFQYWGAGIPGPLRSKPVLGVELWAKLPAASTAATRARTHPPAQTYARPRTHPPAQTYATTASSSNSATSRGVFDVSATR